MRLCWTQSWHAVALQRRAMNLLQEIRHNPLLWLLVFVPALFAGKSVASDAHTLLLCCRCWPCAPRGAPQSRHRVGGRQAGDTVGGLLNSTLGNLTELVIAAAALRAGQHPGQGLHRRRDRHQHVVHVGRPSFLLGGLKYHVQEYNRVGARLQAGLLFLATVALLVPSLVTAVDSAAITTFVHALSVALAVLLITAYGLGLVFSLKTHREFFGSEEHAGTEEESWPVGLALATLAVVTVVVALVSEIFVESVQEAAIAFGMTPAFVGFIVVALVGGAAEMASAFSGARKNRLDLSVGIALGSASQIALFVAPVLVLLSYISVRRQWTCSSGPGRS